jgi:hypothetical protein
MVGRVRRSGSSDGRLLSEVECLLEVLTTPQRWLWIGEV